MRGELLESYGRMGVMSTVNNILREVADFEDRDYKSWQLLGSGTQMVGGSEPKDLDVIDAATVRRQAYKLYFENPYARGIVRTMNKFIFGKGVVTELMEENKTKKKKAEEFLKKWQDFNQWDLTQKETSNRAFRDGELFWHNRKMGEKEVPRLEFIEPDAVDSNQDKAKLGIEYEKDDPTTVKAYWVKQNGDTDNAHAKPMSAKNIIHVKLFVDRNTRRGRSLFEPVFKSLAMHDDWINSRMVLNKVRSAVALVRTIEGTQPQGQAIRKQTANTKDPRKANSAQAFKSGSIITAPAGTKYEMLSANLNASDAATDGRNILLRIAVGIGFPEMFLTGDYSNANFASTSVAQSPFVREFEDWQDFFDHYIKQLYKMVLTIGVDQGMIDKGTNIEVTNDWPTLTYEDFMANVTALGQLFQNEILSKHTYASRLDIDYDEEKKLIDEEQAQAAKDDIGQFGSDFGDEDEEGTEMDLAASRKHKGKANLKEQLKKKSKKKTKVRVKAR